MYDLLRDAPFIQTLRYLLGPAIAPYADERPDFKLPETWKRQISASRGKNPASDEHTLRVTWYSDDDPDNPQRWSTSKKVWVSFIIELYTFTVYIGSSLYTAGIDGISSDFHVGDVVASLGLSLYVLGYGIGPLILSPLSEIPGIGRNPPYVISFFIFVVLTVPTALVSNVSGLLVLRFLLGCFGSPALATGGASCGDIFPPQYMTYAIALWGGFATLGPALGPVVGGFAAQAEGWRWTTWELLWLSGPTFLLMLLALPETSSDRILLQRAQRLRASTGTMSFKADCELRVQQRPGTVVYYALIKPWEINIKDPAMLFTTVYTSLIYGIYYSFFESFPLVFQSARGWSLSTTGLAFLSVLAGLVVAMSTYCAYMYFVAGPAMAKMDTITPETRLRPGLVATFFIPVGLFIFAWTAQPAIPWIVCLIGVAISMLSVFVITQCMFIYLPFVYPKYAASLFAANGCARSLLAAAAILFSRPMFLGIGVDKGVSLLAALTCVCCVGMYVLYLRGAAMRQRSKFSES